MSPYMQGFSSASAEHEQQRKEALSALTPENLTRLVALGDDCSLRAFFNESFWNKVPVAPTWDHLRTALEQENKPVMKLLINWGASAAEEELKSVTRNQLLLLRRCGLEVGVIPPEEKKEPVPEGVSQPHMNALPAEWLKVLHAFQKNGAEEACIAGGALRDLFNKKEIKDIDIFLRDRGSERENQKFIENVFKATKGLTELKTIRGGNYGDGAIENWKLFAGEQKAAYDIVIVKGSPSMADGIGFFRNMIGEVDDHTLQIAVARDAVKFLEDVINGFDIGICQIATDGKSLFTTPEYARGVENKKIEMIKENEGSREHLQRIVQKYPDWKLCPDAQKLIIKEKKIGYIMPDGTIYAGISPDTGRAMYAMPLDIHSSLEKRAMMSFNDAANLQGFEPFGHKDWRLPTIDELNVLFQNKEKGSLKGTFDSAAKYWSSTSKVLLWVNAVDFDKGHYFRVSKNEGLYVRYVRDEKEGHIPPRRPPPPPPPPRYRG